MDGIDVNLKSWGIAIVIEFWGNGLAVWIQIGPFSWQHTPELNDNA